MGKSLILTIFLGLFSSGFAFVKWTGLRATWCWMPKPEDTHCFRSIPRTVREAEEDGYREIKTTGGCWHHGRFHGRRFIKNEDISMTPLYDINGIIAGLQLNRPKAELFSKPNPYWYTQVPEFLNDVIRGVPVYTQTFYYIHPDRICTTGRTERELEEDGTATGLWIQDGPNTHEHNLIRAPLYRDDAIKLKWADNLCVPTMGHHNYYDVPTMQPTNCTTMRPSFLMYNNAGELHGYGSVGVGTLESQSFERPDVAAVETGLGSMTPQCMKDFAVDPGYSNVHMFLVDNPMEIRCQPIVQAPHSSDIYNSPNARPKFHVY